MLRDFFSKGIYEMEDNKDEYRKNNRQSQTPFSLESSRYELEDKQKNINLHWIALYDKFVIAFACLLMFFIGAPLGAIIRKGGLGLPIVFAILIFIIFHFINTFGKKVAQQNELSPLLGCWLSTFVLAPLAIMLTKKATDDKGFAINFDWFTTIFTRFFPAKIDKLAIEPIASTGYYNAEEETKNEDKNSIDASKKTTAKNKIITTTPFSLEALLTQYKKYSLLALICYLVISTLVVTIGLNDSIIRISVIIIAGVFYFMLFKVQSILNFIGNQTDKKTDLKSYIVILGAFPFYPLFYFYTMTYLTEITSENNRKV